jgi:hypothetical protein
MALMLPPGFAVAGRFHQLRQGREHRRRIALGGRRLAQCQRHFAQRHGVAGQRIDQQQHVLALVAVMGGDRVAQFGGHDAHQRAFVGRRDHQHGFLQAFLAQRHVDKLAHLARALADQADHDHVGHGLARHQAQQHRFADAGAGHQADALALAQGQHGIDGAHADVERLGDRFFFSGWMRGGCESSGSRRQLAQAVDRLAQAVDHAAQPAGADLQADFSGRAARARRWSGRRPS